MKNWSDLSIDYYKFLLSQGEKKLDATIETKKQHRVKALAIFSILVSAVSSAVNILLTENVSKTQQSISIVILVLSGFSFMYLYKALLFYKVSTKGTNPSIYKDLSIYNNDFDSDLIFKSVLYSELENVTNRINLNTEENTKLLPYLEKSTYSLILIIPFLGVYFLSLF